MLTLVASGCLGVSLAVALQTPAAPPPATELLERVLDYHDPDRAWFTRAQRLRVRATRADVAPRISDVTLYPDVSRFDLDFEEGTHHVAARMRGEDCAAWSVPGKGPIPEGAAEVFGKMNCDGIRWWRDYMSYLFAMPMNLEDSGARLSPEVAVETFDGRTTWALEVRYESGPIWYFYADPETHALVGVSFHSTPEKADGDRIRLGGEVTSGGIRLPRTRTWVEVATDQLLIEHVVEQFDSGSPTPR